MGDPSERKLAHRVSAPVKVLGVVRPRHPSRGLARKGTYLSAGGDAANSNNIAGLLAYGFAPLGSL